MATLKNFPMKDQLKGESIDGRPAENMRFDCVDVAFAAAIQYLTGKPCTGDELKDAEYGESYKNAGTALWRYVDNQSDRARAVYGVSAEAFNSTDTVALIHQARAWLRQGFPVIATIPSAWDTAHTQAQLAKPGFSTHVVVFYTEDGKAMGAMNPWGGKLLAEPDAWWKDRLCYGQVWKIYKEKEVATATTGVPTGWKDDGTTLTAPNGVKVIRGFRAYVLANKWDKSNWPLVAEYSSNSIEPGNPSIGAGVRQDFRWMSLGWTEAKDVYVIWTGQDFLALRQQLADALKMVEDLKAHASNPAAVVLTPQQKEDLANMAALRTTLASMLDGKAE